MGVVLLLTSRKARYRVSCTRRFPEVFGNGEELQERPDVLLETFDRPRRNTTPLLRPVPEVLDSFLF